MLSFTTLLAASGLLALASTAPTSGTDGDYYGACIEGVQVGVLRFDDLEPGPVPAGYGGFNWHNATVVKGPYNAADSSKPFSGATAPNAVLFEHKNVPYSTGGFSLVGYPNAGRNATIKSFDALCLSQSPAGTKTIPCAIGLYTGATPTSGSEYGWQYENKKYQYKQHRYRRGFESLGLANLLEFGTFSFLPSGEGNPIIAIDNLVIERTC